MKQPLIIICLIAIAITCNRNSPTSGAVDDTHNGSLFGQLLTDGKPVNDTVEVILYEEDTAAVLAKIRGTGKPCATFLSVDGTYRFDSLVAGIYRIEAIKDSIVIGEKRRIVLNRGANLEVNITVVIIINQSFTIWTDQSQNITINNFYTDNGRVEKTDSGYVLYFASTDTVIVKVEIAKDGYTRTITLRVVRKPDGTTVIETIDAPEGITVIPVRSVAGELHIDIRTPGTVQVESTFDTSTVPKKSK